MQNREYSYSRAGDILQIKDNAKGITYDYAYDKLHRLVAESLSGSGAPAATTVETITLDYEGTGPVHGVKTIDLNGVSKTCTYDANGNMVVSPDFSNGTNPLNRAITYDGDNMPVRIEHANGATVNFVYDAIAKRTKKLVQGGKTVLYLGDHYEVENGVSIRYIFGGNLRLAQIKGSLTSYFHKDHLGSTAAVTDASGLKIESTTYEPFGATRDHTGDNTSAYKFTDQELDNETNLYNYDARLYDPVLGMFVTPDSIVPNTFDPQMLNRYSYCRNNPLIYVDPSGHTLGDPNTGSNDDADDDKGYVQTDKSWEKAGLKAIKEQKKLDLKMRRAFRNILPWGYFQKPPAMLVIILEIDPKKQYGSIGYVFENGHYTGSFICDTTGDPDPDHKDNQVAIQGGVFYECTAGTKKGKRPDHWGYKVADRDYIPTEDPNVVQDMLKLAAGVWIHVGDALSATKVTSGSRGCITIPAAINWKGYKKDDPSTWSYYNYVMGELLGYQNTIFIGIIRDSKNGRKSIHHH